MLYFLQNQTKPTSHQRLSDETPAVLTTESVHVNVGNTSSTPGSQKHPSSNAIKNGQAHNMASAENTTVTTTNITSPQKTTTTSYHQQQQKSTSITIPAPLNPAEASMRTIELSTGRIREGFGKFE